MKAGARLTAIAMLLGACVEGQGLEEPFSGGGHLTIDPSAERADTPLPPGAAVIAEAGREGVGPGARVLGRSEGGAAETRLGNGPRPLTGPPISINLADASIQEAAALILGDALGLDYIVDPGVSGQISLRAADPVPPAQLLTLFRAALLAEGLSLAENSGVYQISPQGVVNSGGVFAGRQTAVFPLKNIKAEEVAKALELAVPPDRVRTVQTDGEAILVTGTPEELELARATIAALDIDALAGNSVMLIGLEHAPATSLATELAAVFGGDAAPGIRDGETQIQAGGLRIVPLERISAVMLLARDGATLDRAFAWVRRLDQPRTEEAQRLFIYRVQNRPAETLADSLNTLFAGPAPAEGEAAGQPLFLRGASPPRIVVDSEKNALVISAASSQFDSLVDLIRQLDAAPLQVLVETTILEVTLGDNLRYGVQYAFSTGNLFGTSQDGFINLSNTDSTNIAPPAPGFAFSIGTGLGPNAIIEALDNVSDVTVVSSPKILVRDNQSAQLQVGDQVPIVTRSQQSIDSTANIVNSIEYRDTGVTLVVSPRVNSGGYVALSIDQEISSVTQTTSSGIDSPTISRRSLTTDVTIRDGQTVVLGGLIQDNSSGSRTGIPVLDELPVLGAAFGTRDERIGRTELLVLLRPIILTAPEQAEDVAERLRAQFEAVLRVAQSGPQFRRAGRTVKLDLSTAVAE